ncbi:hypothetical protein J3E74DRAFT_270938 [Bipolaris maydis]|nr:hypothetical protein J3E74DRAFT_270938 [Bipolaris maydis]
MDLVYAALMSRCTEGTFLYTPPKDKMFHPGSCGFFNEGGQWESITDLTDLNEFNLNGYFPPTKQLNLMEPTVCTWKKKVVEKNEGHGFGVTSEVSGLAAQAPVDVGANAAVGSTAKAGAGVVVSPNVVYKTFDTGAPKIIGDWMKDNMENLSTQHKQQIAEFGVWVITATWVAEKCDIAMWNKTGNKIDAGFNVGATNIGKIGLKGSREIQFDNDEHIVYDQEPGGYAISFRGVQFRPSSKFWSNKLKQKGPKDGYLRTAPMQYLDQDGNRIDEDGNLINEDGNRIDKDGNLIEEPEIFMELVGFDEASQKTE